MLIDAARHSLDIMRCYVQNGEVDHGVGDLSVEPDGLIKRQDAHLGSQPSENISAHGHNDHHGIN